MTRSIFSAPTSPYRRALVLGAAACVLLATSCAAIAGACDGGVTGQGRAANPMNYDPPRHYDMEKTARRRAIAAWRAEVGRRCPKASTAWWRARDRKIECDGYAGGLGCAATAVPPPAWR